MNAIGDVVMFIGRNSPIWKYGQKAVLVEQCEGGWMASTNMGGATAHFIGDWWLNDGEFVKVQEAAE